MRSSHLNGLLCFVALVFVPCGSGWGVPALAQDASLRAETSITSLVSNAEMGSNTDHLTPASSNADKAPAHSVGTGAAAVFDPAQSAVRVRADAQEDLAQSDAQSYNASADLIVYGATPAGITAAIEAGKLGHSVILLEPTQHVGGMMSSGLGFTDLYGTYPIGGIAAQFFQSVNAIYNGNSASAGGYIFEPHVAESLFKSMLAEQSNITVKLGASLGSVTMNGAKIAYVVGSDGATYQGTEYIDASYTGDLMAAAGVSYTVGRESAAEYNEPGAGVDVLEPPLASSVDPYIVPGDSSSGLVAHVSPDVLGATGSADAGVMAYNYRLCLSSNPANQIPFIAPANYDSSEFEILKRRSQTEAAPRQLSDLLTLSPLPNQKYDVNNANALSTDEIGVSFGYPNGGLGARQSIEAEQTRYQQALLYFIANDPSVPKNVRSQAQALGLCKDEFTDNRGWPRQIYVREARHMLGAYVITLADLEGKTSISDSIGLGGYPSDSHIVNLVSHNGQIEEDGGALFYSSGTYSIPYRILTPKSSQVTNLLVPVEVSASHVAYDSLRVEVTYMIMGQAAGAAASIAINQGATVQSVPYSALKAQLLNDGQILAIPPPSSLSLSSTNIDFGTQPIGYYSDGQTVTLTNTGASTVAFTSIALAGPNSSSYLTGNTCGTASAVGSLAAGSSCSVILRFYPQTGSTAPDTVVPGTLKIYYNSPNSPQTVSLSGTGVVPPVASASLSATSIAFGAQTYGSYTNVQTVSLSNSGVATLNIGSIGLTGTYASSFLISNNCATTLAGGASCTIRLRFYPQIGITPALAVVPATLTITDNAPNLSQTVSLTGTPQAIAPTITWVKPSPITYGTALCGAELNAISSVPGKFTYSPAAGAVLGAGVQTLTATFTPTDATAYSPATVTTTLAVNVASVSLTATSIVFGTQTYGSYTSAQTVTLGNSGATTLNIGNIRLTGTYASSYLMAHNCATTLTAGASCTIRLRFYPQIGITPALAVVPASLTITDNAQYLSQNVSLTGTPQAIAPTITWLKPSPVTYGTALCGAELNATSSVPGKFTYSPAAGAVLGVGVQTLTATFTPTDATDYSPATVTTTLVVNGASASLSATSVAFGTHTYGSYTNVQTVTLSNSGVAALNIGSIGLTGTYASSYLTSNNCATSLAVGASCTIRVRFYPQIGITPALAIVPASLTITDNALNSPQNVSLTGTPQAISPTITWVKPGPITYGTALSATQLNAASSVAGKFSYSPAAGAVLGVGVQTLTATFTPTDATDYSPATLTTTLVVNGASASLSATSVAFGTHTYGSYTNVQTVTLSNSGVAALNIGSIGLTGTYASSYLTSNNCATSLAVGASCTIRVRFYPQIGITPALAVVPASLTITDNALNSPQNVSLTGTPQAISPTITWVKPGPISYGTALSATQLNATSSVAGNFSFSPAAGAVLAAGVQTLTARFTPADATDYSPTTVTTTLIVNGPAVSLSAPSIAFGAQTYGSYTNAQIVTLTNSGAAMLDIGNIGLTGTYASSYLMAHNCTATLAVGASCTIRLRFYPQIGVTPAQAVVPASLTITDNALNSSQNVSLTGTPR